MTTIWVPTPIESAEQISLLPDTAILVGTEPGEPPIALVRGGEFGGTQVWEVTGRQEIEFESRLMAWGVHWVALLPRRGRGRDSAPPRLRPAEDRLRHALAAPRGRHRPRRRRRRARRLRGPGMSAVRCHRRAPSWLGAAAPCPVRAAPLRPCLDGEEVMSMAGETCPSCDGLINPTTGECRCSD